MVVSLSKVAPFFVLVVTQLHLLRNVSSAYFIFYIMAFSLSLFYMLKAWPRMLKVEKNIIYIVSAIFFLPVISSLFGFLAGEYTDLSIMKGYMRLVFCLPIFWVVLAMPLNLKTVNLLLLFASLLTVVAALGYPYQVFFGGISWFADSSMRHGEIRLASLFGSLTAYGLVCGYGILAALMVIKNFFLRNLIVTIIVIGAVLSLQKAAIANVAIVLLLWSYIKNGNLSKGVAGGALLFLLAFFTLQVVDSETFLSFFDSSTLVADALGRVSDFPLRAINFHSWGSMVFGIGPVGGSGSMGYPEVPMAHNGYVDVFLMGGIPLFLCFVFLIAGILLISSRIGSSMDKGKMKRFGLVCMALLLLNMLFSGFIMFNPARVLFLTIAIKCILIGYSLQSSGITKRNGALYEG